MKKHRIRFDRYGFIYDEDLERLEDSGCGDLTHFYGTSKDETKIIAKLKKIIKENDDALIKKYKK